LSAVKAVPSTQVEQRKTGLGLASKPSFAKAPDGSNAAYAGVDQDDDPETMDAVGDQEITETARRNLAAHIQTIFEGNQALREANGVDLDLTKRLRQMNGEYEPEDEADLIAKNQPRVYINISAHKQRTLVAWLTEFFADPEKSFYIKPTPVPELSPEVIQEAVQRTMRDWLQEFAETGEPPKEDIIFQYARMMRERVQREIEEEARFRAGKMGGRIKDDFVEGRWGRPIETFLNYYSAYGTAGMRSPVIRMRKSPAYEKTKYGIRVVDKMRLVREGEAVSPWDLFPSNGQTDAQDGDLCVRVRYSPKELRQLTKLPCYYEDNILDILSGCGVAGVYVRVTSDRERERLEKKDDSALKDRKILEGVEYWGQASGEMLIGMGVTRTPDKTPVKSDEWYEVNAILMDGKIIYCRVMDADEERPIDIAHVFTKAGSFWGEGPLHVIDHIQRLCNATTRNLLVNMGFASGPQAAMDDASRLHPMDDGRARPNKTWAFMNSGNSVQRPINFWNIPSVAKELIEIFTFYMRLADEITGIPAFANGTDAAVGAARTATGLNMLFGAANRGIKKIVANMDNVMESCIMRLYWWHMRYNKDDSIKGDIRVEVCGVRQFTMREQLAQKQLELLKVVGQDQRMQQLQSPQELARMLREIATGFEIDPDCLAPSSDELERRIERAKEEAAQQMEAQIQAMQLQAQRQQQPQQQAMQGAA
jgi:hypothetical protein